MQEAGYRGKSLFSVEEDEEDANNKIDDEVSADKVFLQLSPLPPHSDPSCSMEHNPPLH